MTKTYEQLQRLSRSALIEQLRDRDKKIHELQLKLAAAERLASEIIRTIHRDNRPGSINSYTGEIQP